MRADKKVSDFCAEQYRRLRGQDYFREDKITAAELMRSLIEHADDQPHIERMITAWIGQTREMMHPSVVKKLARETQNRPDLPDGCHECLGLDYIVVEKDGAFGAKRCSCPRGRKLLDLDREYQRQSQKAVARAMSAGGGQ